MNKDVVKKYLTTYSEKKFTDECWPNLGKCFRYVLVIPAFSEGRAFISNILRLKTIAQENTLLIVVINQPHDADHKSQTKNARLIDELSSLGHITFRGDGFFVSELNAKLSVLVVGPLILRRDHGVGLARKIGCDMALSLINKKTVSCPIIFSTDADAKLPMDYFSAGHMAMANKQKVAALTYRFSHEAPIDPLLAQAISLYEDRLNAYVEGLSFAGSPYAFHTVGSTIAIEAESYAKVRGFPKKPAGEDFYILNKLKKVGHVLTPESDQIILSPRASSRVPFGTGPAVSKLLAAKSLADAKIFYHPHNFIELKKLLLFFEDNARDSKEFFKENSTCAEAFFSLTDAEKLLGLISKQKTQKSRIKLFHDWFDAFRTLKFVHFLRDKHYPMCQRNKFLTFATDAYKKVALKDIDESLEKRAE